MRVGEGCDEGRQRAAERLFDEALALHRIELASGEHGGDDASFVAKDALFAQALEHRIRCRLLPLQLLHGLSGKIGGADGFVVPDDLRKPGFGHAHLYIRHDVSSFLSTSCRTMIFYMM